MFEITSQPLFGYIDSEYFESYTDANFNGISMVSDDAVGWAGTSFLFGGASNVNSVDVYKLSGNVDFDMQVCAFSTIGTLFGNEAVHEIKKDNRDPRFVDEKDLELCLFKFWSYSQF